MLQNRNIETTILLKELTVITDIFNVKNKTKKKHLFDCVPRTTVIRSPPAEKMSTMPPSHCCMLLNPCQDLKKILLRKQLTYHYEINLKNWEEQNNFTFQCQFWFKKKKMQGILLFMATEQQSQRATPTKKIPTVAALHCRTILIQCRDFRKALNKTKKHFITKSS